MNGIPWWYLYRLDAGGMPRPDLSPLDPGVLERAVGLEGVAGCMINSANAIAEPGVIRNSPGTKNASRSASPTARSRAGCRRSRRPSSAPAS